MSGRPRVTLYTRVDCHLCEQALALLDRLGRQLAFEVTTVDVDAEEALRDRYGEAVPVIALEGVEIARAPISAALLEARLRERYP